VLVVGLYVLIGIGFVLAKDLEIWRR